jgi:hypothetical protein
MVRHRCDNPRCVNPNHLQLGTHQDNMRDKVERDRQQKGERVNTAKLSTDQVIKIRQAVASGSSHTTQAIRYKVSPTNIGQIIKRETWKHI